MGRETTDMSADDFLTGLLAVLATRGLATISLRGDQFFEAMEASYEELEKISREHGVDVRFSVFLDPVYRDSPVVREAVSTAVQRNIISLDNPEYQDMRIKFSKAEAERLLADLPGDSEMHQRVADVFLGRQPQSA